MDDREVWPWIGAVAIGAMLVALAALVWLLEPLSHGTSGDNIQVPLSDGQVSRAASTHHRATHARPLDRIQRCIDAPAPHGASGCASFAPTAPPTPADRRGQQPARPHPVADTAPITQVAATSAPATQAPSTQAPATQAPATQAPAPSAPASPTQQPSPHDGPVPGGNTSAPHVGPRP